MKRLAVVLILVLLTTAPLIAKEQPVNLVINPNFSLTNSKGKVIPSFYGWQRANEKWMAVQKPAGLTQAKMGQDTGRDGPVGWMVGDEDWLWQDITIDEPHTRLTLTLTEIQHGWGAAEVRLYGIGDEFYQQLFLREQPDAPTAQSRDDWYTFQYVITPSESFGMYRLEFYGRLDDPDNGWKFRALELVAE